MSAERVAIVGGGIIGTACAEWLSRAGFQVTILDRGAFGKACSHANCGLVVPSHVLPLAMPGAVKSTIKTLLKKNSPLKIRPGFDWKLYRWLFKFAGRCKHDLMLEAGKARAALLESSVQLYQDLIEKGIECEWENAGCLFVFQSGDGMNHHAETAAIIENEFGMKPQRWDEDRLLSEEPALKPGIAGAWYYERDCHLRPDRLLSSWRDRLESQSVTIREHCELRTFQSENGSVRSITTSSGDVEADHFVVATGAWTPLLHRELNVKIPIQPGKGYSLTMPRPAICPKRPLLLEEHRVAVTPMQTGYRLGSMMEFVGYDSSIDPRRLELLKNGAEVYLKDPHCEPIQEKWFGWRPMTYDGIPIIDCCPDFRNVIVAAGHNMLGLSMAPATGKLVAELLTETSPHIDPQPYSLTRF